MGGNKLKINGKVLDITPGIRKVLTETSNIPLKNLNDKDQEIFVNILESLELRNIKQYVVNPNQVDMKSLKLFLKNAFWKVKE